MLIFLVILLTAYTSQFSLPIQCNFKNKGLYLTIPLSLGTPKRTFNYQLSTSHINRNWIFGKECIACGANTFDKLQSSSFSFKQPMESVTIRYTDYSYLTGNLATDKLSFSDSLSDKLEFAYVNNITNFAPLASGSISLSFPGKYFTSLKEKKKINNAIVTINLLPDNENETKSLLTIDEYDKRIKIDPAKIKWADVFMENTQFTPFVGVDYILGGVALDSSDSELTSNWYFKSNFLIGSKDINEQKFSIDINKIGMAIPKSTLLKYQDDLLSDSCEMETSGYLSSDCSEKKILKLKFNNNELTLTPDDYKKSGSYLSLNQIPYPRCELLIKTNYLSDHIQLGMNFLEKYYIIMDYENSKIGFYDKKEEGTNGGGSSKILLITLLIILGSACFFILLYIVYKKCVATNEENEELGNNVNINRGN